MVVAREADEEIGVPGAPRGQRGGMWEGGRSRARFRLDKFAGTHACLAHLSRIATRRPSHVRRGSRARQMLGTDAAGVEEGQAAAGPRRGFLHTQGQPKGDESRKKAVNSCVTSREVLPRNPVPSKTQNAPQADRFHRRRPDGRGPSEGLHLEGREPPRFHVSCRAAGMRPPAKPCPSVRAPTELRAHVAGIRDPWYWYCGTFREPRATVGSGCDQEDYRGRFGSKTPPLDGWRGFPSGAAFITPPTPSAAGAAQTPPPSARRSSRALV